MSEPTRTQLHNILGLHISPNRLLDEAVDAVLGVMSGSLADDPQAVERAVAILEITYPESWGYEDTIRAVLRAAEGEHG